MRTRCCKVTEAEGRAGAGEKQAMVYRVLAG